MSTPAVGKRGFATFLSFRGVALFWCGYGLLFALLRLWLSPTLAIDDARANELVQQFALGYEARQPPLYGWLLWPVQTLFGSGLESHLFIRYVLVALIGLAAYGAVHSATKDGRWAAAASLSLVVSYPIWTFHEWATQTLLLCVACFASFHAAVRFIEKPAITGAVWLGLAVGLGLHAKFSFPLFLGGLVLACLTLPEARHRLRDPRLLVSAGIAVLALSPYLYWLVRERADVMSELVGHMVHVQKPYGARVAAGIWLFVRSMAVFPLPWVIVCAILAPRAFNPFGVASSRANWPERLALRAMFFAAFLAAAGIVVTGATNIGERYMHPILMVGLVFVFARIARLAPNWQTGRFVGAAFAGVALMLAMRVLIFADTPISQRSMRGVLIPYRELAEALAARGISDGTIVAPTVRTAGNVRAFQPSFRVMGGDSHRLLRPPRRPSDDRSCVLVAEERDLPAMVRRLGRDRLDQAESIEVMGPASPLGKPVKGRWRLLRLDPGHGSCL